MKNRAVTETRLAGGEVLLEFPAAPPRGWAAALARLLGGGRAAPRRGRLELDSLGTAVWDRIDGKRSIAALAAGFAAAHRLDGREAEIAVTQFLRELGRRGLIGLR